jgi:hypothetical protein
MTPKEWDSSRENLFQHLDEIIQREVGAEQCVLAKTEKT